ncbi:uncharacterized protein TNCV_2752391 [Trichonephila clavipes]|nr:uncharacterized protein TNCV_2752391 [Trichonephila clavipes]
MCGKADYGHFKPASVEVLSSEKLIAVIRSDHNIPLRPNPHDNAGMAQWLSGSVLRFHTTSPGSTPGLGKVNSTFRPYCSGSINEYQKLARELKHWGVSIQTHHLIGASAHEPQRPMVTYIRMGTVGPGSHGLLRH